MHDDCVDITPPFRADPHVLGTTLFEGEEDDMGMKAKVKPNFRTPPSCGQLVEDWHASKT
jgi:hypothetical protein